MFVLLSKGHRNIMNIISLSKSTAGHRYRSILFKILFFHFDVEDALKTIFLLVIFPKVTT